MSSNNYLFELAQLAEASYADLTQANVQGALEAREFSTTQAAEFVKHWKVISHQPDQASGFSATLFQNKDDGRYVFAIRGTAGAQDLLVADGADIVADGLAMDQIVDLYNFWHKLTAPQGSRYQIANLVTLDTETNLLLV